MAIVNIFVKTGILLACSIVQLFAVLFEGTGKIFEKLGEYLVEIHDILMDQLEKKREQRKAKSNTPS